MSAYTSWKSNVNINTQTTGDLVWSFSKNRTKSPTISSVENRKRFIEDSNFWTDRLTDDPVKCTQELYRILSQMSKKAGIDYLTKELVDIANIAESVGGGCKPSGAGGGDCAIAFFNHDHDKQRFQAKLSNNRLQNHSNPHQQRWPPYREQSMSQDIRSRKADHIDLCIDEAVGFKEKTTLFEEVEINP